MIIYNDNYKIYYSDRINDDRYFSGFSTKTLGDARQPHNMFSFFREMGIKFKKIIVLGQIHSVNIEIFESLKNADIENIEDTDGVITKLGKNILTIRTADCLPILFVDKKTGIMGASHQGWRGSIKRMPEKIVKKMIEYGANLKTITAVLGPAIGQCCYNIDIDRYNSFSAEFEGYSDKIISFRKGKYYLNLNLLNYFVLQKAGVKKNNIDFFPFCTQCNKEKFFSFRRERKTKDYGEIFSFIVKLK